MSFGLVFFVLLAHCLYFGLAAAGRSAGWSLGGGGSLAGGGSATFRRGGNNTGRCDFSYRQQGAK